MASTSVCWISGNKKEREKMLAAIRGKVGECDEYTFGSDTDFATLESQVLTSDIFAMKRLIIVTALPAFNGTRQTLVSNLKRVISAVPEDCLLVFYGIEPEEERAIYTHVSKEGKVFDYSNTIPLVDAEHLMQKLLTEAEKTADDAVLSNLLRHTQTVDDKKNYTIDQINIMAQKLISYLGTKKTFTDEDVRQVATGGYTANVWQLFDAIDDKNYDKCLSIANKLVVCEAHGEWAELCIRLIHVSLWRYKMLMFIKEAKAMNKTDAEVTEACASLQKLAYDGVGGNMKMREEKGGYSPKQIANVLGDGFMGSALNKYTRGRLARIMEFLQEALEETRYIQSGDAGFHLMVDLYLMVACEKIDDKRRRKLWSFFQYDHE